MDLIVSKHIVTFLARRDFSPRELMRSLMLGVRVGVRVASTPNLRLAKNV